MEGSTAQILQGGTSPPFFFLCVKFTPPRRGGCRPLQGCLLLWVDSGLILSPSGPLFPGESQPRSTQQALSLLGCSFGPPG
jgi:hypothetical protein